MKAKTYYHGDGHSKWGIWNNMRKEFQFGICENTPLLAEKKLWQKIGNDARKWRFEVKQLPRTVRDSNKYEAEVITRGNCMMCGKELTEGLFFCKECSVKMESGDKE